ncbi:hypothetical protein E2C01_080265 [Portunus trituberculatus]|uniref:Uncharacterized protein n=1 Tax=Portunus trituberculatus TaxID=210409 RepID=A0A5B7IVK4_PORTR|nr:hypothetical protein [Portunus trituberculatus]
MANNFYCLLLLLRTRHRPPHPTRLDTPSLPSCVTRVARCYSYIHGGELEAPHVLPTSRRSRPGEVAGEARRWTPRSVV